MSTGQPAADRNQALDFVKGVLVVLMVVYHWGNYFLGNIPYFYEVLRFLTPSFILITGAILSLIYMDRYRGQETKASKRLAIRGAKLLVLFTALNLAIQLVLPARTRGATFNLPLFTEDLYAIYITGNSFSASFKVLLPIAYLLLLAFVLLRVVAARPLVVAASALTLCTCLQVAEFQGHVSPNLMLVSFGFLGLCLSAVGIHRINALGQHLLVLVVGYLVSLLFLFRFGMQYWAQVANVAASLLLIYEIGRRTDLSVKIGRMLVLLGSYSLFGYVIQIAILQVLRTVATRMLSPLAASATVLPAALVLMILAVYAADLLRKKVQPADRLYRAVFA